MKDDAVVTIGGFATAVASMGDDWNMAVALHGPESLRRARELCLNDDGTLDEKKYKQYLQIISMEQNILSNSAKHASLAKKGEIQDTPWNE